MGEPEPQDGRSTRPPKPADPVLSPSCPLVTGCIPTGAPLAKGEYIKFVFQDDVLFPTCVKQLLGAMRDGVRFAFCAREFLADDGPSRARASAVSGPHGTYFAHVRPRP